MLGFHKIRSAHCLFWWIDFFLPINFININCFYSVLWATECSYLGCWAAAPSSSLWCSGVWKVVAPGQVVSRIALIIDKKFTVNQTCVRQWILDVKPILAWDWIIRTVILSNRFFTYCNSDQLIDFYPSLLLKLTVE